MSSLNDLINDLDDKNASAVKIAGDLIGTFSSFSGAFSTLESIISHDASMNDVLNEMRSDFTALTGQIAAEDKLQRMRAMDQVIDPAIGVFEQLPAILATTPAVSQEYRLNQIQICEDAVISFTNDEDKWLAVQADLTFYSDRWSGKLAPEPRSDGLVFNYTYTLPQFLRAIYTFLTAIRALEPSSLQQYQATLSGCLQRLESVHQTIVTSGIVGSRVPSWYEVGSYDPNYAEDASTLYSTDWLNYYEPFPNGYWPYGAVEIYSGASTMSSYMEDYFNYFYVDLSYWGGGTSSLSLNFLYLLQFRIRAQQKALYIQLGMPAVRQVMSQLRQLTGQPPIADVPYEAWPMEEVASTLNLTLPKPTPMEAISPPWLSEPRRLEPILSNFLKQTPPYISFGVEGYTTTISAIPLPSGPLYTFLTGYPVSPMVSI
jgi:hypothetical protein